MSDVVAAPPVNGAPVVTPPAGEPTFDELAALLPDNNALPGAEKANTSLADVTKPNDEAKAKEGESEEEKKAKEGEEEPEEEKEEDKEESAEAKEALERAEAAARKAREGSRRYREMLEQQRRVQMEAERAAREAAEHRRRAEEAARFQEDLRRDPYAALKKLGMTDQELAERALREGTPENELRTLLQQQQEALAAERQRREALEQRLEAERQAQIRQQAEANFQRIADNEQAYPRLSQLAPAAQLAVAQAALQQIASNGYDPSVLDDEQVAEACERFLAPKKAPKSAPAQTRPAAPAAPAAAAPPKASNTLTNAVSTTKASMTRPWEELSDDEQIAAIAASLPDP